jgi:hypothetical protein
MKITINYLQIDFNILNRVLARAIIQFPSPITPRRSARIVRPLPSTALERSQL